MSAKASLTPRRSRLGPVLSKPVSEAERWFKPTSQAQVCELMKAARQWTAGQARPKGRRWGPLTPTDLEVYEALLFKAMAWKTGALDWSYNQIATAIRRSKQTVADALARLRGLGFLDWIRRYEFIDGQVRQATNAYRVALPAKVKAWLAARRPPPPADFEQARADRAAELRAYDAQANGLADALDRLGRAAWSLSPDSRPTPRIKFS